MKTPPLFTAANCHELTGDGEELRDTNPHAAGRLRLFGLCAPPQEYAAVHTATAYPEELIIPRAKWPGLIAEAKRSQTLLSQIARRCKVPVLNQYSLPYCHAFSPAEAVMLLRAANGLPFLELSAGSIGGPATGYRARGAAIEQDLDVITTLGIATTAFVPMSAVAKASWKPGAEENALLHRVTEWWKFGTTGRMFDEIISALFRRFPVCVGLNWWRHAVTYFDPEELDTGEYGVLFRNSWGPDFGEDGFARLDEDKGTPDVAYAPRVTFLSEV